MPIQTPVGTYTPVELCAVLAILIWVVRLYLGLETPRRGAFGVPAALLLAAGVLSTAVADYPRLALRELRTLVVEPALFYVVARSVLRGPRDAVTLGGVYVTAAAAAGALALFQTLTGQGLVVAEGVERAAALFRSPNNLGLLLGRALPLAAAGALYLRRPISSYFWFAGALCTAALFFTFSRGAWLAATAGLLLVGWPVATRGLRGMGRSQLTLAAAGLVGLASLGVVAAAQVERFRSLFSAAGTGFLRFHLWGASLRMALDHPVFGAGLDQFLYHYPRYMHPDAWREPNLSHPHNVLLDFWLRLGLLGVAALVVSVVTFLRRTPSAGAQARAAGLGAAGAAVALLMHGLVDNSYFLIDLAYGAWTILLVRELASEASA